MLLGLVRGPAAAPGACEECRVLRSIPDPPHQNLWGEALQGFLMSAEVGEPLA